MIKYDFSCKNICTIQKKGLPLRHKRTEKLTNYRA